jgi:uncharacterized repeat protein (TIGR04076 family)
MPFETRRCKITVLKRTLHQDLIDEYLDGEYRDVGPCEQFSEGQEFIIDPSTVPEDFCACCPWAWADIRNDIMTVAVGGDIPGMRQGGTTITGCRDWFRLVLFKIERLETTSSE